jgi:hypothetical protein
MIDRHWPLGFPDLKRFKTVSESRCQELTRLARGACSRDGTLSNTKLARMSSGRYCLIRDLGLVKGGRGLRHHEVVLELSWHGLVQFAMSRVGANRRGPTTAREPEAIEPNRHTLWGTEVDGGAFERLADP